MSIETAMLLPDFLDSNFLFLCLISTCTMCIWHSILERAQAPELSSVFWWSETKSIVFKFLELIIII